MFNSSMNPLLDPKNPYPSVLTVDAYDPGLEERFPGKEVMR